MSRITMPAIESEQVEDLALCRPYLAVDKNGRKPRTIIVGRDNTVLFFDPEDGTICHGTLEYLYRAYRVVRPYRAGEVFTYVQG